MIELGSDKNNWRNEGEEKATLESESDAYPKIRSPATDNFLFLTLLLGPIVKWRFEQC